MTKHQANLILDEVRLGIGKWTEGDINVALYTLGDLVWRRA